MYSLSLSLSSSSEAVKSQENESLSNCMSHLYIHCCCTSCTDTYMYLTSLLPLGMHFKHLPNPQTQGHSWYQFLQGIRILFNISQIVFTIMIVLSHDIRLFSLLHLRVLFL